MKRFPLVVIVFAQFLGTSLWFSANGVVDRLAQDWGITTAGLGYLTSAIQLGFIVGTLLRGVLTHPLLPIYPTCLGDFAPGRLALELLATVFRRGLGGQMRGCPDRKSSQSCRCGDRKAARPWPGLLDDA